jgi:hypothetical protein
MPRLAIIALGLVLVLASCGGDPVADPTSTPSRPMSTVPTPPAMPAAAKANTKAGAIAFVRYYVETLDFAVSTGDVSSLRAAADSGCASCADVEKGLEGIYNSGATISGGLWTIDHVVDARPNEAIKGWTLTALIRYGKQTIVRKPPETSKSTGEGTHVVSFRVSNRDGDWKVQQWSRAN